MPCVGRHQQLRLQFGIVHYVVEFQWPKALLTLTLFSTRRLLQVIGITAGVHLSGGVVCVAEGQIAFSDQCVDLPTQAYTCEEQAAFGSCYDPFMVTPQALWQGGYCQKTCGRCSCNPEVAQCSVVRVTPVATTHAACRFVHNVAIT